MRGVSANKPPMAASKCRLHITTTIKLKKSKEHLLDSFQVKKFANRKIYANKYPLISSIHSCSVWFLFACFLFGWMEALLMEMLLAVASLVFQWLFILVKHFHHVAPRSSAAVKLQHLQLLRSQDTQQHRNKKTEKQWMSPNRSLLHVWNHTAVCATRPPEQQLWSPVTTYVC